MASRVMQRAWFPREHGFWVMLSAALGSGLIIARAAPRALAAAALTAALFIAIGSLVGPAIRRRAAAQLVSALALSLAAVPVLAAAGTPLVAIATTVLAWATVFASSALVVRSAFNRLKPRLAASATLFDALAVGACVTATVALATLGADAQSRATAVAAAGVLAIALYRPTAKHLKAVGLALAGISLLAVIAMSV